jgi:DNA polymerase III epsilon subunit family exonuclease
MFDLSNARFAFLDIETTGLSPWFGDRICEVAIVATEGKRIKGTYCTLINPERALSPGAFSANALTEIDLRSAPLFAEVADKVQKWLADSIVVCHNARFDLQFLDSEYRRMNRELQFPNLIDTLLLARQYFDLPSYSLHSIADAFHLPTIKDHGARQDALNARSIFFAMLGSLKELKKPLEDFIGIYNSPAWPNEGIQLPIELGEAIYSGKHLFIRYLDKDGEQTERWVTPKQVIGLADYIYLQAYCHLRESERSFRLDRIVEIRVESSSIKQGGKQ